MNYFFTKNKEFKLGSKFEDQIDYDAWKLIVSKINNIVWDVEIFKFSGMEIGHNNAKFTAYIDFRAWCEMILIEETWSFENSLHVYDYTLMLYYDRDYKFGLAKFPDSVDESFIPLLVEISNKLDCYLIKLPDNCEENNTFIT